MPIDSAWSETPQILASVFFNMIQEKQKIGWGYSMRFADVFPEFVNKYLKSAIYFGIPCDVPDEMTKVRCAEGEGYIYLASYISEAEHQFFVQHGSNEFESLLEKEKVGVFNISRSSVI